MRGNLWLAIVAVVLHFASFGNALPWPFQRFPLHRHYHGPLKKLAAVLPLSQPPAALGSMWMYYQAFPELLPRHFPEELPLTYISPAATPARVRAVWAMLLPLVVLVHINFPNLHRAATCVARSSAPRPLLHPCR